jgi:hypothetical protein
MRAACRDSEDAATRLAFEEVSRPTWVLIFGDEADLLGRTHLRDTFGAEPTSLPTCTPHQDTLAEARAMQNYWFKP